MSAFAKEKVYGLELFPIDAEQIMQQGKKEAAGVVGGKIRGRLNANYDQPQDGGDPGFEDLVAIGGQTREGPAVPEFPPFAKNAKDGAPTFSSPPSRLTRLFDGIVGGLAGDHDVVDVAFAQAGAADADEARFLQQFWNRRAATVAHAGFQSADHLVDDHGN